MDSNIFLLIIIPLATAFMIPLIDIINLKIRRVLVFISASSVFLYILRLLVNNFELIRENSFFLQYNLGGWLPPFGINLVMDNLSLFFSLLISLGLFLIIIYSIGFIGHHEGKYYVLLFLVFASAQGVILTGDLFNLYVFIELLTVASAPLVGFKRNRKGTEAAIKYLFYGIIGGVFFLIGAILIYFNLGTLNMAQIAAGFADINYNMQITIITIFLISLLIKLGIFPFHYWLPKAHSSCPSSVSALLSGIMMKIYLYVFLRVFFIVIGYAQLQIIGMDRFIIYLALISSFLGHIFALQADDIKRMLAFSTIGHISMITAAVALNTQAGLYGGLLHVISHLLMKSGLFTGAGYLLQYTKSHQINDFNGVGYSNKSVFITFITNALGMIGIPPLIGFISKWYILLAFLKSGNHTGVILVIFGSLTAVLYYLRYISHGLDKSEDTDGKMISDLLTESILTVFHREEVVKSVIYIFTAGVLVTGIFFKVFDLPINAAVEELLHREYYIELILGG